MCASRDSGSPGRCIRAASPCAGPVASAVQWLLDSYWQGLTTSNKRGKGGRKRKPILFPREKRLLTAVRRKVEARAHVIYSQAAQVSPQPRDELVRRRWILTVSLDSFLPLIRAANWQPVLRHLHPVSLEGDISIILFWIKEAV